MRACERSILAKHHIPQCFIVSHTRHHYLATGCQFSRRFSNVGTALCYLLRFLPGTIIDGKMIACVDEPQNHVTAHMPQANKSNTWFSIFIVCGHDRYPLSCL